jgi:hypothetical protein
MTDDRDNASHGARGKGGQWLVPSLVAGCAAVLMVLAAGSVRGPDSPVGGDGAALARSVPALSVTRVAWLGAGELRERLRLLDPTPLYMPDAGSGVPLAGPEGMLERPGGEVTRGFPPALAFPDERPARDILRSAPPQSSLAASEVVSGSRWFTGMARREAPVLPAPVAGSGRFEVYRVGEGERIASLEFPQDAVLATMDWRPMELMVQVQPAGLVAPPVVMTGSGVVEVDEQVRVLVTREWLPRLLLRPGAYRLLVGP